MNVENKRVHFVVFGDSTNWKYAKKRLLKQIESADQNFQVTMLDESWLFKDIRFREHQGYIKDNPIGFGNWIWKPNAILTAMDSDTSSDYIVYLDAGCEVIWNEISEKRFYQYLGLVDEAGGLFFELEGFEKNFTSAILLEAFGAEQTNRRQIMATTFILGNNSQSKAFLIEWFNWMTLDHYKFLVDSEQNRLSNSDLVAHRFDQSILSLLVHKSSFNVLPDETYWSPNWSSGEKFPIWASRNRTSVSVKHSWIRKLPHRIRRRIYIYIRQKLDKRKFAEM
jgi:hypothetical protein